ncbi:PP0621 family protein [Nitratiruptor sp. SB155-2]|uniref:PP0621 family protein n=1 Tax=Nitratiruptor sp. (strain SB155-2) TaxID=387092 RepID=UPI0001586E67|nr:PP0621 family protein [Nitratiruptor sp. SB155-2]BAF69471.1 conserved hypothetical protein [Nitratiruptor sp. SB155-2]
MLFKILLLAAVIGAIYYFFIKKKPIAHDKETDTMVECDTCGTYVSNKEAIIKNGKYYCSKECAGAK